MPERRRLAFDRIEAIMPDVEDVVRSIERRGMIDGARFPSRAAASRARHHAPT